MTQELNTESTNQPYKLSFYYEAEKNAKNLHQTTDFHESQGNYDGLVVQTYDDSIDADKARYERNLNEHGSGCILSAFLYFITITSFVYLAVLWIKQRMHMHVEQMQWW